MSQNLSSAAVVIGALRVNQIMPVIVSKNEGPDQTAYHVSSWYLFL